MQNPAQITHRLSRLMQHAARVTFCALLAIAFWAAALQNGLLHVAVAAPAGQAVRAEITSPQSGDTVQGTISIRGTAMHPDFWKYELAWSSTDRPGENWNLLTLQERQVLDGQLAAWNTNLIPDGAYDLRLRVVGRDANYTEVFVRSITIANLGPPLTPTVEGTLTPLPTLTPLATLIIPTTPTVSVARPTEPATPTPALVLVPTRGTSGPSIPNVVPSVNIAGLGNAFCYGAAITLGIFLLLGILQVLRRILPWILR